MNKRHTDRQRQAEAERDSERDRQTDREKQKQTDKQTGRQDRQRHTSRQADRQTDRQRQRDTERDRDGQTDKHTQRHTGRQPGRQTETIGEERNFTNDTGVIHFNVSLITRVCVTRRCPQGQTTEADKNQRPSTDKHSVLPQGQTGSPRAEAGRVRTN